MNISLPDSLKLYVDEQVDGRGYGTSSEYVRELIRQDRDRPAPCAAFFSKARLRHRPLPRTRPISTACVPAPANAPAE